MYAKHEFGLVILNKYLLNFKFKNYYKFHFN